ncbi:MAG: SUMF1/EgtB/PvdO family nonheme iron enzyme [Phycisphaerae bacterium]
MHFAEHTSALSATVRNATVIAIASRRRSIWPLCVSMAIILTAGVLPAHARQGCTPPINEDCPDAIVFTTADLPFSVTAPLGCVNNVVDKPYWDIFYRYDCLQTAEHIIDMCDSDGDTYLRIYTDGCGWADGNELAVADDECPGSPPNADPALTIVLEAGNTYWFELGTWRPEPPWAPPPNSPYHFNVSIATGPVATTCDGVDIATRIVADPGNDPDGNGLGAVAAFYRASTLEITNRQYVDFLNSTATTDTNGLYNQGMTDSNRGGILRTGAPGSFTYFTKENFADKPVNWVSWLDAARFCNWLHNGQPIGLQGPATTESGAYDMSQPNDQITRLPGATWFLPTHDQWYKAAYYDVAHPSGSPDYWLYPTRSDSTPTQAQANPAGDVTNPGINVANYGGGADWNGVNGNVTTTGGTTSASPWSMADMGGNVLEMTETPDTPIPPNTPTRTARGGDFANAAILMSNQSGFALAISMVSEAANVGFRVAAEVCPGDFDGDGHLDETDLAVLESCFSGSSAPPTDPICQIGDFDGDGDVDCADASAFVEGWTQPNPPPPIAQCTAIPTVSSWGVAVMALVLLAAGTLLFRGRAIPGPKCNRQS